MRLGSSFHNFGAASLIDLSLNPEKDLPLKNTSKHATGSIELKLNPCGEARPRRSLESNYGSNML